MTQLSVLVVGAGPVGLSAAVELRRHGIDCRIIDELAQPRRYAKAVGVQPRTLEVWESLGLLRQALDAAIPLRGQLLYVNGALRQELPMALPPDVPYGFAALPQYETERLLTDHLARDGTQVERRVRLTSFTQDAVGVTAALDGPSGTETVRCRFLIGCDGAHSVVRKGLGLSFDGDAFPESYMLGDVEVDWSLPEGFTVRSTHQVDGRTDDLLMCVPLPGRKRYRMSMLVPPELSSAPEGGDVGHGFESGRAPQLSDIQAVLDRLSPEPTTASALRWSSVFRISHRLVDRYGEGRVFVAGDAAHIHPPTGAQGMNTGIQDAHNLAWKLALVLDGAADQSLLASYDAERHPVGEEVVGRTVRHARAGFDADPDDPTVFLRREAQLLVNYRGGPLVAEPIPDVRGPQPGDRAPDCRGLIREVVGFPLRLFDLLPGIGHTLLLYADDAEDTEDFDDIAEQVKARAPGRLDSYAVLARGAGVEGLQVPAIRDAAGEFRNAYGAQGQSAYLVRPDGYLGYRAAPATAAGLLRHLDRVFTR